jgi:hypothetical protein
MAEMEAVAFVLDWMCGKCPVEDPMGLGLTHDRCGNVSIGTINVAHALARVHSTPRLYRELWQLLWGANSASIPFIRRLLYLACPWGEFWYNYFAVLHFDALDMKAQHEVRAGTRFCALEACLRICILPSGSLFQSGPHLEVLALYTGRVNAPHVEGTFA